MIFFSHRNVGCFEGEEGCGQDNDDFDQGRIGKHDLTEDGDTKHFATGILEQLHAGQGSA